MVNGWENVTPMTRTRAVAELALVVIEVNAGGSDPENIADRIMAVVDGVYLQGWRDKTDQAVQAVVDYFTEQNQP